MKQKKYFILAAAAILMAACSENDIAEKQVVQQNSEDAAIEFGAYVNRGTTRAGLPGKLDNAALQNTQDNGGGFGVFGYYTDGELYAGNTKPNFFYNQGVFNTGTAPAVEWTYTPVKYWPNEFGTDAVSDQVDRVSLFAYAPYVEVDPLTGYVIEKNTENITGMSRNNATGDPIVKYVATLNPTNTVDLCYAVAAEDFTSSNSTKFRNDIAKGKPFVNLTKPALGGKIKFDFKHALAKLNVQIDYDVNNAPEVSTALNAYTKIWVRSVVFEGITTKGALNLHTGEWYQIDASGDNKISSGTVTIYDGLKDGKEPVGAANNEMPATLNPAIIQSDPYKASQLGTELVTTNSAKTTGVTASALNLFKTTSADAATALAEPVYVIPTGEKMKITIVYDVETYDKNLAYYLSDGVTPGSTIQNSISKTIDSFGELVAGKQYVLKLHLGMRSVDFEANVVDWDAVTVNGDANLPSNLPNYVAVVDPTTDLGTVTIGADEKAYRYTISGLTPAETANIEATNIGTSASSVVVTSSGIADVTAQYGLVNTTTTKKTGTVKVTGETSGKGGILTINQAPHAIGLKYISCSLKTLTLGVAPDLTGTIQTAFSSADGDVKVEDISVTPSTTINATIAGHVLTLSSAPVSGHKIKVTVKDGEVTESIVFVAP